MSEKIPILRVENLRVFGEGVTNPLVGPLSFELYAGECLALLGDSGSGKSLTLRALLGLLPENLSMTVDRYEIAGSNILELSEAQWNALRGATLALVQQDTGEALDPLRRVQQEVLESAVVHRLPEARRHPSQFAVELLGRAGLGDAAPLLRRWPHQLSGGMRQRAVIASALSASPSILFADEPTTALDASVRQRVLETLNALKTGGQALLLVTHDMSVVSKIADRLIRIEHGTAGQATTVTAETLVHDMAADEVSLLGMTSAARVSTTEVQAAQPVVLRAQGVSAYYDGGNGIHGVSFELRRGHTLGILGESGAGKTTLARVLTGVMPLTAGEVFVEDIAWSRLRERDRRPHRWQLQWVPQDALASFARGMTVEQILAEALGVGRSRQGASAGGRERARTKKPDRTAAIEKLLADVHLDVALKTRNPRTLSGGQRQRLAIARALATEPNVLICDEAVSALDAGVRASVLNLFRELAESRQLATVFISHDVDVIAQVSDDVLVMREGRIVEQGSAPEVLTRPQHPFTRGLLTDSGPLPPERES